MTSLRTLAGLLSFVSFALPLAACAPPGGGAASPASVNAGAVPAGRDPKIVELAKPALACKFEDGSFDADCPALAAWSENDELFADGKGNDTLFSMLADSDAKVRVLAARRGIDPSYFEDKAHAAKLFALANAETGDDGIGRDLAAYVAKVDAEKLGLQSELRALAKHPSASFREGLAFYLISTHQTPIALEVEQMLIDDAERSVRSTAINALSTGGVTPGVEPVCKLLSKQLVRSDELAAVALRAGASSRCAGMKEQVAAELAKRVADPSKITNAVGVDYALASAGLCSRDASADLKKKALDAGKKLSDAKVPDSNTRRAAIDVLVSCDPAGSGKLLGVLAKDKDKSVADAAKKRLDEPKKK